VPPWRTNYNNYFLLYGAKYDINELLDEGQIVEAAHLIIDELFRPLTPRELRRLERTNQKVEVQDGGQK
jgi:hypothetical protein